MKRTLLLVVVLALTGFAATLSAQITNSVHDLSSGSSATFSSVTKSTTQDQTCIFCHTPHTTSTQGLLWNRTASAATYTLYDAGYSLGDASKRCLSCHDGTVAVSSLLNGTSTHTDGIINDGAAALGTDLSNDHPVGATLTVGTYYQSPVSGAQLLSGKVECSSCHDPHKTTHGSFLRMSNAQSALCRDCHVK